MIAIGSLLRGQRDSYEVLAEHGRGGFGVTYRCRCLTGGGEAILKVLRLDRIDSWKAHELFEREAAVLRALDHASIPAWLDDFPLGDEGSAAGFALVQQLIPGATLHQRMRAPGGLSPDQMRAWLRDILEVLVYLHERTPPVIHRDVTPRNIILKPDGRAALVDFGSVQAALRAASEVSSTAAGSFGYAPMEQFVGRAGPASDLYGLGMTYLAVAVGREPSEMPLDGARVDVRGQLQGDRRLVDLIEAMTAPDPRQRPASAREALGLLARLASPAVPASAAADATEAVSGVRVSAAAAYLTLLTDRLRVEGFSIVAGGQLGDSPLALTAVRGRGPRRTGAIRVLVAQSPVGATDAGWWPSFVASAAASLPGGRWRS